MTNRFLHAIAWPVLTAILIGVNGHEHRPLDRNLEKPIHRCGTRGPTTEDADTLNDEVEEWTTVYPDALTNPEETITCTYAHVIEYDDGTGGISDELIDKQMRILNKGYRSAGTTNFCEGDSKAAQSRRCRHGLLIPVSRDYTDTKKRLAIWFQEYDVNQKWNLRRGDEATLNLYIVPQLHSIAPGPIAGYSSIPIDYVLNPILDGVVVAAGTLPGGDLAPFNEGDTVTHEVGHWLGLFHTFEGGCEGIGDAVDDTPAHWFPGFDCYAPQDTCPGGELDPITNFMDYSPDCCMNEFTAG